MSICQNGAPPMYLPIENVTVSQDQNALSIGVPVQVGSNAQIVSLRPGFEDVSLYVVNKANCAPSYNDTCAAYFGGLFNPTSSATYHQTIESLWNGTDDNPDHLAFVYFNDVLAFGNATAYGFPLFMDQQGYGGQGTLPLGWKSNFLSAAVAIGAAPSEVFGLWSGSRSIGSSVPGSLVLGGVDTTRYLSNEVTSFPSSVDCSSCIEVTAMTYDTINGSVSLFSNSSESLQVALVPSLHTLNVPQDVFMNFAKASNGTYILEEQNIIYPASYEPNGNITVTLNGGYKTTIPSTELFTYPRLYNPQGVYSISNTSFFLAEISNVSSGAGFVYQWGIPYLTMNYFIGDWARSRFQMAPAIRTDFQSQGAGYMLSAICDPVSTTSSTHPPASSATHPKPSTPVPSTPASKSNTGAIVGGVVGGVLGLILIVGGLALLFYRSRRQKRRSEADTTRESASRPQDQMSQPGGGPSERMSHYTSYTGTTPHDPHAQELHSATKSPDNRSVDQWLSSHGSDHEGPVSPTVDRPFEMPAHSYD